METKPDLIPAVITRATTLPGVGPVKCGFFNLTPEAFERFTTRPVLNPHSGAQKLGFVHAMYCHGKDPGLVGDGKKTDAIKNMTDADLRCLGLDGHIAQGSLKGAKVSGNCVRSMDPAGRAILEEISGPLKMEVEKPENVALTPGKLANAKFHTKKVLRAVRADPGALADLLQAEGAFLGDEGHELLKSLTARASSTSKGGANAPRSK